MSVDGSLPDDLGRERVLVREADLDLLGPFDHVVVRDDVAGLVDDEAGAERLLHGRWILRRREGAGVVRLGGRGRDLDDAGRGAVVDLGHGQRGVDDCRPRVGQAGLDDGRRRPAAEPARERCPAEGDEPAEDCDSDERSGTRKLGGAAHAHVVSRLS